MSDFPRRGGYITIPFEREMGATNNNNRVTSINGGCPRSWSVCSSGQKCLEFGGGVMGGWMVCDRGGQSGEKTLRKRERGPETEP